MKLHELDPQFVSRLENWGMYFSPAPKQNVSTTHEICLLMAVAAGKEKEVGYAESHPRAEIDEQDAQVIEWCMSRASYRMSAQSRGLIKAHYVSRADPRVVARVMRIRYLSWEKLLCEAVIEFRGIVEMLESCQLPKSGR